MAAMLIGNEIKLSNGAKIGICVPNSLKNELVEIIETKQNQFVALFDRDDVDFKVHIDNSGLLNGLIFDITTLAKGERFYVRPNSVLRLEAFETNGGKLHFIDQDSKAGNQLVCLASKQFNITREEASIKISRMDLKFQAERLQEAPTQQKPVPLTGEVMHIFVNISGSKTITMKVGRINLVKDLKQLIQNVEDIPPNQQVLTSAGHQLEDGKTLSHYKIGKDSTVFMLLRLRGGASTCIRNSTYSLTQVPVKKPNASMGPFRGRGAICLSKKSNQTFEKYYGFIADPSVVIAPISIEFQIRTDLKF